MFNGNNIMTLTDSYKQTHYKMYPPQLQYVESYLESRTGGEYDECVFFGLKYLLETYLSGKRVTLDKIGEADQLCTRHFGQTLFNLEGWRYILDVHKGRLPVSIHAVAEGTVVPTSNVLLTIRNTDPKVPWLVNHLETLLVQLWYPCTVATISRSQKKALAAGLEQSGTPEKLPFMLHDFGFRGSTSVESAALGGAAHLTNFVGTDTIAGIELLQRFYQAGMPGLSVPAAEHSTITAWGRQGEAEAYQHILNQYPTGIVSVVSDSWDVMAACRDIWGDELKDDVVSNDRVLVVRPDSGNPAIVLPTILDILGERFGYTTNEKGYKVLPDYVRLIQGDGIDRRTLPRLLDTIMHEGWSLDNFVFGSGGGLLQDCNRDTMRFALKCCWAQVDGRSRNVYKQPATDLAKASKSGLLKLVNQNGNLATVGIDEPGEDMLNEVFRDGTVLTTPTLDEIRARSEL